MQVTINSGDTQAVQSDVQLLLAQMVELVKRALEQLHSSNKTQASAPKDMASEDVRIQMGKRIVYGQLASGEFRNELDSSKLQMIFDAFKEPAKEDIDPGKYKGRVPDIEVKVGKDVLFRRERDGVVTVNQIQETLQQQTDQALASAPVEEEKKVQTAQAQTVPTGEEQAESQSAPINSASLDSDSERLPDVAERRIENAPEIPDADGDGLIDGIELVNGTNPLNADTDGDGLTDALEVVSGTNPLNADTDGDGLSDGQEIINGRDPTWASDSVERPVNPPSYEVHYENQGATSVAWEPTQNSSEERHLVSSEAVPKVGASVIAQQQASELPLGSTKELLVALGRELGSLAQQMGQRVANWVASIPETKRHHDVARTALDLFNNNYRKTGETTYQAENYTISLKGTNNYVVSDLEGKQLMQFKKEVLGIRVLDNKMMAPHYQDFADARRQFNQFGVDSISSDPQKRISQLNNLAPKGDREAVNAAKTKELMDTAQSFLKNMGVSSWNPENGNYSIERQNHDHLHITSKTDGRGTVLLLENGQLTNNLDSKDFSFFRKVERTMEQHLQQKQQTHQKPKQVGIQLG